MKKSAFALVRHDWRKPTNSADPTHYTDDFSSDKGYFTEENGAHNWKIENGVLTTTSEGEAINVTYLHIYEHNVTAKAKVRLLGDYPGDSAFGFILRYNSDDAFVKVIYRAFAGVWCIDFREGADFIPIRLAEAKMTVESGVYYDIEATLDGDKCVLKIDGKEILSVSGITHTSPGRVGFICERLICEIDSCDFAFLSNEGVLWKNCKHTKLPDERYREGGSAWEMKDGSILYEHHYGDTFVSADKGATWERRDTWIQPVGYMNVLRLINGDFIRTTKKQIDGIYHMITATSSDEGATWADGGIICPTLYHGIPGANAGNMNDKLLQIASGRIFYGQNYEIRNGQTVDGRYVFCEFYYSDDNGKTWTKSDTDSWDIPGNEGVTHFGECKMLECADGTIRMYNSWNGHGCVVYSESKDGGKTFGPMIKIPELVCARSSMQFCRDYYAENDTTYYMVWVYSEPILNMNNAMGRSRLSLAKSTDGKNWQFLGDAWRWEINWRGASFIAHVVDPFVIATKDKIVIGSGISEELPVDGAKDYPYHNAQRQHIWSVDKASLTPTELKPV